VVLFYFKEWVIVVLALLTFSAEVEIFADRTFVAHAENGADVASVASDVCMLNGGSFLIDRLLFFDSKSVLTHDLLEDKTRLLFHLVLDKALKGLARDSVALLTAVLALLAFEFLILILEDLLLDGD